ncbi:MBL fold metallo-hydrolase [Candidatus Microgenomates bacterium]|nr:MBL fold metallo-hydrolase [Candidatus Microgenomates bacterium]
MEPDWKEIRKKIARVLVVASLGLGGLFLWQGQGFSDGEVHLIFCDVGQGDAILIRKNTFEILIDGGPDNKVLACLSENMAFWDKEIEIMVLTHPEADHLNGLIPVLERYQVNNFISSPAGNTSAGFKKLKSLIEEKEIPVKNLYTGGKISFEGLELFALWPEKEWLLSKLDSSELAAPAYADASAGKAVLGAQTSNNRNDFSLVFHLKYGQFDALLTGDADERVQDEIMEASVVSEVKVFKVPHHGSKTGMIDEYLESASPELAVISVGKNRWGHPTKEILERLRYLDIEILRTDQEKEIEIVTDGKSWQIR